MREYPSEHNRIVSELLDGKFIISPSPLFFTIQPELGFPVLSSILIQAGPGLVEGVGSKTVLLIILPFTNP